MSTSKPQADRRCLSCGYSLVGIAGDHCPECGVDVSVTDGLKRLGALVHPAPGRVCAVCGAPVSAGPDGEAQRCSVCHSRYIRSNAAPQPCQSQGLAALRERIGVLPAPTPPPRREERSLQPPTLSSPQMRGVPHVIAGMALLAGAGGLALVNAHEVAAACAVTGVVIVCWGVFRGLRVPAWMPASEVLQCARCSYPLPPENHGRCPECGKLVDELPEDQRFCPGCRRTLRAFRGDNCPECGVDVRRICEGVESGPQ